MREAWPVTFDPVFGCAVWTGKVDQHGYAVLWRGRRPAVAYRIVYEAEIGVIPVGLVLDHVCRDRLCVPVGSASFHLEAVTKDENERRKSWSYRCRRARCARGHSMEHALVTPTMGRLCRTCTTEARRTC